MWIALAIALTMTLATVWVVVKWREFSAAEAKLKAGHAADVARFSRPHLVAEGLDVSAQRTRVRGFGRRKSSPM